MEEKMNRRQFLKSATAAATAAAGAGFLTGCNGLFNFSRGPVLPKHWKGGKPNFVIIFCDDLGYADVGCFGAKGFTTPNIDRMAAEGMRFTDFYVGAPFCSPSRAAILTGCYPQRVGIPGVLFPNHKHGLNPDETTIADMLKPKGYATACVGKWHLGHHPEFLPTQHGFDEFFGLPYSNDMWPKHPNNKRHKFPDLPLIEGSSTVELNPDQSQLTTRYTERSVKFIEKNRDKPFFLYLAHTMPHVPLFVSDKFKGKSQQGLYGDVVMEIDWSVGQILSTLKRQGLDEKTIVIFTSDNGPWLVLGNHGGSAEPLREGKGTTFDGGQREACVMRWPGKIPAGLICNEVSTTMDILPTFAGLAGAKLPARTIDGKDIRPLMANLPGARSPHEAIFFYNGWNLQAVRSGRWKLHLPHGYKHVAEAGKDGRPGKSVRKNIGFALFDLKTDISERHNVAEKHPRVVGRLLKLAEQMRRDLGDGKKMTGRNRRPPGRI